ncbi:deleted in malignant brain tumors 1 protein-like [Ictalurus furcatus]|uniref:deleted in malignant brain tumors 1 protein-like n=1 Tax=Ictalurus furcatus TaxID=66913 RepID=UPI0023507A91|nr:deleted in malignant brain tumors 1 protein-like [Ictalurus furcatus]
MTVIFSTDRSVTRQGFQAEWTFIGGVPCGRDLTQSRGEFFSPNYPNDYPNDVHCVWRLQSPSWQIVSLNFTFVKLEMDWDFITVYDGPTDQGPPLGIVTGNQGNSFSSSSRYMTVVFHSDSSWTENGFRAEWRFLDEAPCGGNLTQSQGEFFSPNFPHNYPNNAKCTWRLQGPEQQVVSLTFTFVDLESTWDSVHVYDGPTNEDPQLGAVTANQMKSFNSSSRYMTVVFSTDRSVTQQGFRAEWTFIGGAPCGGTLTQSQGEFFSPNYPNNYPNYANCTWSLLAGELQVVSLNFKFVK